LVSSRMWNFALATAAVAVMCTSTRWKRATGGAGFPPAAARLQVQSLHQSLATRPRSLSAVRHQMAALAAFKKDSEVPHQFGIIENGLFDSQAPRGSKFLAEQNSHPRDNSIDFLEDDHKYFILQENGSQHPINKSVTELVQEYKEPFDASDIIQKMMTGDNWPRKGYTVRQGTFVRPMMENEIKTKWYKDKTNAANRGTYMHHVVEWLLADPRTMLYIQEMRNFFDFYETVLIGLGAETYRLEWRVFDPVLLGGLAATIDYVGRLPDGTFLLIDWKRSKELKREAYSGRMMKEPFSMLPDTNLGHYELQVNLYKLLLLRNYHDVVHHVSKMLIVMLHPGCYEVIEARDLQLGVVDGQIRPHQRF